MRRLTHRERDLLWLAYAQGSSHDEIAAVLGLKAASIKSLLFRQDDGSPACSDATRRPAKGAQS